MDGFLAVTDPGWYERLSREAGPRDANFWRPSTRRFNLAIGTPFLFKLKAPYHAIAGYGFFAGFSVLPDWLAWETFGEANGVDNLEALRDRLRRIQVGARIEADPVGQIGCCLIAEARFFPQHAWVTPPHDWSPRIQTGATYDLAAGEGLRVWQECLARAPATPDVLTATMDKPRYGKPSLYLPRLGQGIFRVQVLEAYGRACSVTGEHSLPVLEAAHIRPYARGGDHDVKNGLTLRTDIHRLFDRGYVTVDEGNRFVVGRRLKDHFENGRSYYGLHGRELDLPAQPTMRPSREALAWHREQVFMG
ncbi:HNH endonuclease [Polyangium mundeleinium]|uniref:HNH endonuclease n=1 Tax=Polyangium mundeleinium TaxID=2995306 RepID=A0ABT5ER36_9BACT|nr:HNH endonuclease [Polyangium mundeleinium]MDC0743230.1 HNH endonuclease [Polyangium mundeleinium]